ncbi:AIR synthase family protein [Algoriphagus sp. H41]|uniref:AIR synthase family protein n=1 Tax=Algoriphagus oliviformis TaxID=2811231 RepID=A0ABS3C4V1_9BACT|nr:AIR synthase family protein [Algoriphagus oliviformis]MBN7811210.1 AIR synthase family protein [Algoriphagus oliviformis]
MGAFVDFSGKVDAQTFKEELMGLCGANRPEVLCGPAFGVDTAIVDLEGGQALAVSSDPLSLIPGLGMKVSAWLSVHLLANDMSTTGFAPQFAQFVLNLPTSLSREQFAEYWGHIHSLCQELGIAITGGHTGQIPGQESTISGGGTMFLQAPKDQILSSNQAQAGDVILLSKHAALSSTALLAMAFPETVTEALGEKVQQIASTNFWKLSVLPEALIASVTLKAKEELRAMHDVTEGGVLGALIEMAEASGLGFRLEANQVPVPEEVQKVAQHFDIDPLISVGAGAMLMTVKAGSEEKLIRALEEKGIPATRIGVFTEQKNGLLVDAEGQVSEAEFDGQDPYWAAFFKAVKEGKR